MIIIFLYVEVVLKKKDGNDINYLKGQVEMSSINAAKSSIKKVTYKAKDGKVRNKYTMVVPLIINKQKMSTPKDWA